MLSLAPAPTDSQAADDKVRDTAYSDDDDVVEVTEKEANGIVEEKADDEKEKNKIQSVKGEKKMKASGAEILLRLLSIYPKMLINV